MYSGSQALRAASTADPMVNQDTLNQVRLMTFLTCECFVKQHAIRAQSKSNIKQVKSRKQLQLPNYNFSYNKGSQRQMFLLSKQLRHQLRFQKEFGCKRR